LNLADGARESNNRSAFRVRNVWACGSDPANVETPNPKPKGGRPLAPPAHLQFPLGHASKELVSLWQDPKARLILLSNFFLVVGSGITWIAVPWLLIHQPDGEALYGISNAVLTLLIFVLLPYLGKVIDRNSRKKIIVGYFVFGIATNLSVIAMILIENHVAAWHLIVAISLGSLGASVYYPAQYAFNQEVLSRDQYRGLSGAIEVQWQTAAMIAGGLAAFLVNRVPLTFILLFDALTFASGLLLISFVPYQKTLATGSPPAWEMMLEGFSYLRRRPRLSLVMFSSFLPFLGVMLGGYLTPIFVKDVLKAGPEVYGFGEVFYSLGAVIAGLMIPSMSCKLGLVPTLLLTVGGYTIAVAANPLFPLIVVLLCSMTLQGWGNAGSRVARSTLTLETVPNELMGRVTLFFSALERLLRAIFLGIITHQVAFAGAKMGFWTIAAIGAFAWITIMACRRFRRHKIPPGAALEKAV
jgi:MFS family permease